MYVVLPDKVVEELKRRAELEAKTIEEAVADAVLKFVDMMSSSIEMELHMKLCEKYLCDADELLKKADYVQASEKAWGAASQIVKAVATKEGVEIRSHRKLHEYVSELVERSEDRELGRLWRGATSLHKNFYENWFTPKQVVDGVEDVKNFVERLKRVLA